METCQEEQIFIQWNWVYDSNFLTTASVRGLSPRSVASCDCRLLLHQLEFAWALLHSAFLDDDWEFLRCPLTNKKAFFSSCHFFLRLFWDFSILPGIFFSIRLFRARFWCVVGFRESLFLYKGSVLHVHKKPPVEELWWLVNKKSICKLESFTSSYVYRFIKLGNLRNL